MSNPQAFWSYVRKDDEADRKRIQRLASDIVAEYEMLTGDSIDLFLDRDELRWGVDWKGKVDAGLESVAFFIAILTPRYFQSVECRRELNKFARQSRSLGVEELVLPILYIPVPALTEDDPTDAAVALVKTFQWEDWTDLRFESVESSEYRRAVSRLAKRLADANNTVEESVAATGSTPQSSEPDEEEPGILDRIGTAEESMPQFSVTLVAIGAEIDVVGKLMQRATTDLERGKAQGKAMAARLTVLRRLAGELEVPVERITQLGENYTRQLNDVDQGLRVLIERAPEEAARDDEARNAACELFASIRQLDASSDDGLGSLKDMVDAMGPVEPLSRDLRPVLRKLRKSLTLMYEGRDVMGAWVQLIDDAPLDCGTPSKS